MPGQSAGALKTPYFLLVQMNNAPLVEAYATLGIEPVASEIEERRYPKGLDLDEAFKSHCFGAEDKAEHPGTAFARGGDPIRETEAGTHGAADETLSLAEQIAGRFPDMVSDGADFGAMVAQALEMAKLPGLDFDPDILGVGAVILGQSASVSSCTPDLAGQAPFSGFRADYRPESAPLGPKKVTPRRRSFQARFIERDGGFSAGLARVAGEIFSARRRGHGKAR